MSRVSSEARGRLAFMAPASMFLTAFGDNARAVMDAYAIELNLTPGCIGSARAARGDARLAG